MSAGVRKLERQTPPYELRGALVWTPVNTYIAWPSRSLYHPWGIVCVWSRSESLPSYDSVWSRISAEAWTRTTRRQSEFYHCWCRASWLHFGRSWGIFGNFLCHIARCFLTHRWWTLSRVGLGRLRKSAKWQQLIIIIITALIIKYNFI